MSRHTGPHRPSRHLLRTACTFLLAVGLLLVGPAGAHTFTKTDGNDSPGKLDIRSASVSHTSTGVVHKVRTYDAWTPASLQHDSFFIFGIDKNNDRNYERCAFIFYTTRLRGSLTNCGNQFIRYLPVAKLNATTAKVTIPKTQTGNVYWWYAGSLWDGPAPCGNGCVDFAPNNFPDILHDMIPPVIGMSEAPLLVWESSLSANFNFPFSVTDANSGVKSWKVLRVNPEAGTLTTVAAGTAGGARSPIVVGVPGQQRWFHVEALDRQGNRRIGPERQVLVPFDDDELGSAGVFSAGAVPGIINGDAYGGTYTGLGVGETLTYTYTDAGHGCREFALIGPGTGDWFVDVIDGNGGSILASLSPDLPRQTLFTRQVCDDIIITFEVLSGSGFFVDAIAS